MELDRHLVDFRCQDEVVLGQPTRLRMGPQLDDDLSIPRNVKVGMVARRVGH